MRDDGKLRDRSGWSDVGGWGRCEVGAEGMGVGVICGGGMGVRDFVTVFEK